MKTRHTIQRQMVLNVVKNLNHPTAYHVYEEIKKQYRNISLGTVYRNLNFLVDAGDIQRLAFKGSPEYYDQAVQPHYHLKCTACGEIVDLWLDYFNAIDTLVMEKSQCKVHHHTIDFCGLCPQCVEQRTHKDSDNIKDVPQEPISNND